MSKQEIGFEIWGEVRSNDPCSLHTYVTWKKNKEATKSFSNFPFIWWGGGRRGLPTKHIPVSPVQRSWQAAHSTNHELQLKGAREGFV